MSQDYKWKSFCNNSTESVEEVVSRVEDVIKNESDQTMNNFDQEIISLMNRERRVTEVFFEDKGMVFGLSENIYLVNKSNYIH